MESVRGRKSPFFTQGKKSRRKTFEGGKKPKKNCHRTQRTNRRDAGNDSRIKQPQPLHVLVKEEEKEKEQKASPPGREPAKRRDWGVRG